LTNSVCLCCQHGKGNTLMFLSDMTPLSRHASCGVCNGAASGFVAVQLATSTELAAWVAPLHPVVWLLDYVRRVGWQLSQWASMQPLAGQAAGRHLIVVLPQGILICDFEPQKVGSS